LIRPGSQITLKKNADQFDTLKAIDITAQHSTRAPEVLNLLKFIRPGHILQDLYNICRDIQYIPDRPGVQNVKTPSRTLRDQQANCVNYTLLISTILRILKKIHTIRMVDFKGNGNYSHIYIICDNIPVDPVIGWEIPKNNYFGIEAPFKKKYDLTINKF